MFRRYMLPLVIVGTVGCISIAAAFGYAAVQDTPIHVLIKLPNGTEVIMDINPPSSDKLLVPRSF